MYAIMKEVVTYSVKARTLFFESMSAKVLAVIGSIRTAKAKIILINWVLSMCGLMAGCNAIDSGAIVPGMALMVWFFISSLILIERKDSPEMREAAGWIDNIIG